MCNEKLNTEKDIEISSQLHEKQGIRVTLIKIETVLKPQKRRQKKWPNYCLTIL